MKIKLILAINFFLLCGCAGSSMPDFPDIKFHYAVEVRGSKLDTTRLKPVVVNYSEIKQMDDNENVRCLKFEILNKIPYKIKYTGSVDLLQCDLVGGYQPNDSTLLYNWLVEVKKWADEHKQCFKQLK